MVLDAVRITGSSSGKVNDSCQLLGVNCHLATHFFRLRFETVDILQTTDFNFHIEAFQCRPMLKAIPNSGH